MFLSGKILSQAVFSAFDARHWFRTCSRERAYAVAGRWTPWLAAVAALCCAAGLYLGLFGLTVDPGRNDVDRIVFVHLPASCVAILLFVAMTALASAGAVSNAPLAALWAQALAPTGLLFAFLSLWTGCLWGKPFWGHWWVWDLRTVAELALVLVYAAFVGLHLAVEKPERADRAVAVLCILGFVCVPVNVAAVQDWTASQLGAQSGLLGNGGLDAMELLALFAVAIGFLAYACAAALMRLRCIILEGECRADATVARGGGGS